MQIAFFGNTRGKSGITSNMAAVSTFLALEMKIKSVLFENHVNLNNIENGFLENSYEDFVMETPFYYHHIGIDQVMKRIDSGIQMQEMIKDAAIEPVAETLFYIPQSNTGNKEVFEYELNRILEVLLKELNKFAQMVFVDTAVSDNLTTKVILEKADLIIMNLCQDPFVLADCFRRFGSIRQKCVYLLGNYDRYSRYTMKYVMRSFGVPKERIAVIPYNTEFKDALSLGKLVSFLSRNSICGKKDENYYFMRELKHACLMIQRQAEIKCREEGAVGAVL